MVRTFNLNAEIPASRELHINLPVDIPEGPADIVLVVSPSEKSSMSKTFAEFGDSEFFGMWRNRADVHDSVEFARNLRSESWKRLG